MTRSEVAFEFPSPPGASKCTGCGAAGPVGIADVASCPWCNGSKLPASAVVVHTGALPEGATDLGHGAVAHVGAGARVVGRIEVRPQGKAARRVARSRR